MGKAEGNHGGKKLKGKTIAVIVVACAAVLGAAVGVWKFIGSGSMGDSDTVVYVNSVSSITGQDGASGVINRFAGVVETQQELKVNANSERTVEEIYVEEGQEVKVGDKLFSYETEKSSEDLSKANLELERIEQTIENKTDEIAALEKEKKSASSDAQLDYTIQIQDAQMDLKESEYEKQSKEIEIQKLEDAIANSEVLCEMDGVVKSINSDSSDSSYSGDSEAFMTIIAMGDYRIKCTVNEQNVWSITAGEQVIVHSRVDEDQTWTGTLTAVDTESPVDNSNSYYYYSGDSSQQSNSYPFYVELDSSDGLLLGQHVYVEPDRGQEEEKTGIWLDEYYISDIDTAPWVWADNGSGKLEKRSVTLGGYDSELYQYEIVDGLTEDDLITFPEDMLEEGMETAASSDGMMGYSGPTEEDPDAEDADYESDGVEDTYSEESETDETAEDVLEDTEDAAEEVIGGSDAGEGETEQ